jgi:type II secretory pathway component PulJ
MQNPNRLLKNSFFCSRGITLLELLMAMAMGSMLIAAIYTVYAAQVKGQITQETALEFQQGLRSAMLTMKNEIRTAGMDPTGKAGSGVIEAEPGSFRFTRDVTGYHGSGGYDGETSGPGEDIRYAVNKGGNLARETCRPGADGKLNCSGLQAILNNVDVIDYVYLDGVGNRISDIDLQTLKGRNRIAQLQVTIIARYDDRQKGAKSGAADNYVFYNQFGDPLATGVFHKGSRRHKVMTTIALRNIK